jgi:hypothetical protein
MSELLQKLADCIEFGKINKAAPYPPQMKGLDGADEITKQALEEGVNAQRILTEGLMVGNGKSGYQISRKQGVCATGFNVGKSNEYSDDSFETLLSVRRGKTERNLYYRNC